jgi:hypothetical protein
MRAIGGTGWFGQSLSAQDKQLRTQIDHALKLIKK